MTPTDDAWMGWRCDECGVPFPHGRDLVEHLLSEHPAATPGWVGPLTVTL